MKNLYVTSKVHLENLVLSRQITVQMHLVGAPTGVLGAPWQIAQMNSIILETASFARCCQTEGAPQGAPSFILHT